MIWIRGLAWKENCARFKRELKTYTKKGGGGLAFKVGMKWFFLGGEGSDDGFMAHCTEFPLSCEATNETDFAEESESPEEAGSSEDSVGDGDAGLRIRRSVKERNKSGGGCKTTYNLLRREPVSRWLVQFGLDCKILHEETRSLELRSVGKKTKRAWPRLLIIRANVPSIIEQQHFPIAP